MNYKKTVFVLFLTFFIPIRLFSQQVTLNQELALELNKLEKTPLLARGDVGLWVQEVESGNVLVNYKAERSYMPASNLKVVSTATALELLGEDYRYKTSGYYSGKLDSSGVLIGNLYIVGSGDPSLGSDQIGGPKLEVIMDMWAGLLVNKGIKKVTGDVIIDVGGYDANPVPDFWPWADLGNYYGAGSYGLNIADNMMKLYFQQNRKQGQSVKLLRFYPDFKGMSFESQVVTGPVGSRDQAYIYGGPFQENRMVLGTLPPGDGTYTVKGSMPDPPAWFGYLLKQAVMSKGIRVTGGVKVVKEALKSSNTTPWFTYESPSLAELIRITNFFSVNLYAESIFQHIALARSGKGDREQAVHEVKRFWSSVGVDTLGWILKDGSGLSPLNAISPEQMGKILRYMLKDSKSSTAFASSLPSVGKEGTVYWLGKNTGLENNAKMKSGSFTGTLCYSGYMMTKSNKKVVFSIMMNRYEGEMRDAAKKLISALDRVAQY